MKLNPIVELKKRVGKANIIHNSYLFDIPCSENSPPENTACWTGEDQRSINIWRQAKNNYKYIYELDPYWGHSIQCGAIQPPHGITSWQRNIDRFEFLYSANLSLMYGAKFFSLYTYFAQRSIDSINSGLTYHGIVDHQGGIANTIYTDKWKTMRDTLNPRLKGLFGKTIKKLIPGVDSLNINPSMGYDLNLGYLKQIELVRDGGEDLESYVDLRFFRYPEEYDDNYFMLINRWYSKPIYNRFRLKFKDLLGYTNWNLKNFMDSTNTTLLPDQNGNITSPTDTILAGDAILYSIKPVVTDGGTLALNDTISAGTVELYYKMTINDSVTLTVNSNYIIKDTVTLTGSGFIDGTGYIDLQSNGKIIISGWDRSLFKGRSGNHPKLIWAEHPAIGNIEQYKIYRKKETPGFNLIKTISDTLAKEFIDTTVIILDNPHSNETLAEYYITAVYYAEESYSETNPSNTIRYQRVEGSGFDKKNRGEMAENIEYNLEQNYPNPFNPSTVIKYSVKESGMVELEILNILGERVKTLVNEIQPEGNYEIAFNAGTLASGIYLYRLKINDYVSVKKMILMK